MVIKLVKAYRGECHATPGVIVYGADLRFVCENCQLDGFSFLEGCCPLCIYEEVCSLYYYILTRKKKKECR